MGGNQLMFRPVYKCESLLGLYMDKNYRCVKHIKYNIFFSFAQRGEAITAHFSSDKESLRKIKAAIEDFFEMVSYTMPWCRMVLAAIKPSSVARLVVKCGFFYVMRHDGHDVYGRRVL